MAARTDGARGVTAPGALPPATEQLAAAVGAAARVGAPPQVHADAVRRLLAVLDAAVGAAQAPAVDLLVQSAVAAGESGTSLVPGRVERLTALRAAQVTGYAAYQGLRGGAPAAASVHAGVAVPDAAVVGAVLPLVAGATSGALLLDALALGVEVQLRLAGAMSPSHAEEGWHVTGTVGPVGAAVAAGVLIGLDDVRLRHAIAIASSTSLGHGRVLGTSLEPFSAGKAAANGLLAASLARRGFTGAPAALEGARGWFYTLAPSADLGDLLPSSGAWRLLDVARRGEAALPAGGSELACAVRDLPEADCSALLAVLDLEAP